MKQILGIFSSFVHGSDMEVASVVEPATSSSGPIRSQYSGHVIRLDQSEDRTATSSSVNPAAMAPSENAERWFVHLLSSPRLEIFCRVTYYFVFEQKIPFDSNVIILSKSSGWKVQNHGKNVCISFYRISKKPSDDKDSEYVLKWGGHNTQLLELFSDLLSANTFTDVSLEAESKTFHAHQLVLSACSPYFRNLFITSQASHQTVFCKVKFSKSIWKAYLYFVRKRCLSIKFK